MKLKDALQCRLSEQELKHLVQGYDVVGDIAITIIPPELVAKEQIIGETLLQLHKNIRVVVKRDGNYSGEYRVMPLKIIAGENRTETVHKEHGVRFFLNPGNVYFSVRSSHERKRLATLVQPDEHVLVMFSGIGAFPLVIAENSQASSITGIEKNHHAHGYAVKNLAANRKIRNVRFLEGDVLDHVPQLDKLFQRVVMPLPKEGEKFLGTALGALEKGGWLHYYDFQQTNSFHKAAEKVKRVCTESGRDFIESSTVICGHCGPRTYRLCVDARIY